MLEVRLEGGVQRQFTLEADETPMCRPLGESVVGTPDWPLPRSRGKTGEGQPLYDRFSVSSHSPRLFGKMSKSTCNFARLDSSRPDVANLIAAMLQARQAVERRSWASPLEADEYWWADVLSDPRALKRRRSQAIGKHAVQRAYYALADEQRSAIAVACTKCSWQAEFSREDLIAMYGLDYPLPNLLNLLASSTCAKVGSQWDRCGAYYVNPID
jgi:hypothetical protein